MGGRKHEGGGDQCGETAKGKEKMDELQGI